MRICLIVTAVFAVASTASAAESRGLSAIVVRPIHEAQVAHGYDRMDRSNTLAGRHSHKTAFVLLGKETLLIDAFRIMNARVL
jgi:hypothetical protein